MLTNIILDMDGTLLDHGLDANMQFVPVPRAYLTDFMQFVFDHFERVSIWTAASLSWYERCYEDILRHHVPEGKSFHFVMTREDYDADRYVKPLRLVYEQYPDEYNPDNTLIVDDNHLTYAENLDNAVPVQSFVYHELPRFIREDLNNYDYELLDIIDVLNQRLGNEPTLWSFRIPLDLTLD
jgi:hypothetical protein